MDKPIPEHIKKNLIPNKFVNTKFHNEGDPVYYDWVQTEPAPCDDCDRTVINRTVTYAYYDWPKPHWRVRCRFCGKFKHLKTGEFCVGNMSAHAKSALKQD